MFSLCTATLLFISHIVTAWESKERQIAELVIIQAKSTKANLGPSDMMFRKQTRQLSQLRQRQKQLVSAGAIHHIHHDMEV